MDSARDKKTSEIIDAEDLKDLEVVDQDGYICQGCNLKLEPCSYRPHNLKRPYFKIGKYATHDQYCEFATDTNHFKYSKTKNTSSISGMPLSYPSSLILSDTRDVIHDNNEKTNNTLERRTKYIKDKDKTDYIYQGIHHYQVSTINSIARKYLGFTNTQRSNAVLNIEGVSGTTYKEVIEFLPPEIISINKTKLWFANLCHITDLTIKEGYVVIPTLNGYSDKNYDGGYKIAIITNSWSKHKRNSLISKINTFQNEYKTKGKQHTLFFIGTQSQKSYQYFIVEDYRLFSCLPRGSK